MDKKFRFKVGLIGFTFTNKTQDNKTLVEVLESGKTIYTQFVPNTELKNLIDFLNLEIFKPTGPYDKDTADRQTEDIENEVMRSLGQI